MQNTHSVCLLCFITWFKPCGYLYNQSASASSSEVVGYIWSLKQHKQHANWFCGTPETWWVNTGWSEFLHQVFPTLDISCSSILYSYIPAVCVFNQLHHVPLGFQQHVLLCITAVTWICFLYLLHCFWVDRPKTKR